MGQQPEGRTSCVELFRDDFTEYPLCERLDAPDQGQTLGPWQQTSLHYAWRSERIQGYRDCPLSWRIVERDGRRFLDQPESFFNVVFKAGDPQWRNYTLEIDVAVCDGPAGPVVRYRTSRRNYWVAFEAGEPVKLVRRDQDDHVVLGASADLTVERDTLYHCCVTCDGPRLGVAVDGTELISVEDDAYAYGAIALRTEGPSRFASVRVLTTPQEAQSFQEAVERASVRVAKAGQQFPPAKLIHSVQIPLDTSYLHIQDVNDDGRPEILAIEAQVMILDYIRLARLSVFDWDGKLLWQLGEPLESKFKVHGDIAFNIADIDADGQTEILVTRDFEILTLEGATGKVKRRTPTPRAFKGREDRYERTVGDSFLVCDLRGLDSPQDFVLKDRYCNLWAYTGELEPLWHRALNTGHYPRARDINEDGRDEVMGGYSLLGSDGNTRWTVPGSDPLYNRFPGPEHCDSVLIEKFGPGADAPLQIAMAASDLGFLLLDADGNTLAQHKVGHAQNLGCGRFRPDLPGRQFAVRTAWGNQGIMNLFDCEGNLLLIREMPEGGVMPVNWLGDGSVLLKGSHALLDGTLDPVVALPEGRPVRPIAYDVNDDGLDEVLLLRGDTLEVYAPETRPAKPVPTPTRDLTNWNLYGGFYR